MQELMVSEHTPDWSREYIHPGEWNPGKRLLKCLRFYEMYRTKKGIVPKLLCKIAVIRHRFWSAVSGADIPLNCKIDGGLLLPHPNGVVIHPLAVIGPNCLIFQQVTIGMTGPGGYPKIGGHVDIGAGAKVLGAIIIGNNCRIGANTVVVNDVPPGSTVISAPSSLKPPKA
jgi:serine O-acetyltransferase